MGESERREFFNELKEKNSTKSGAYHHKKYKGKMKLPYELMKKEERKKHMEPQNEKTIDLGELMPWKEFTELPKEEQKQRLFYIGKRWGFNCEMIGRLMQIGGQSVLNKVNALDLGKEFALGRSQVTRTQAFEYREREKAILKARGEHAEPEEVPEIEELEPVKAPAETKKPEPVRESVKESAFTIKANYSDLSGAELEKILHGIASTLIAGRKYTIALELKECSGA